MNLTEAILAEFTREAATTRRLLERLPDDRMTWSPHTRSMSLGRLADHLAQILVRFRAILDADELDFATAPAPAPASATRGELLERFDRGVASFSKLLGAQPNERLVAPWRLRQGDRVFFEMPRVAAIRAMVLSHSVHHRGQLSVYLRLLDVPLPPVYGPTADEQV